MRKKLLLLSGLLPAFLLFLSRAAMAMPPAMDDPMLKNGKIYVVVAVLVVIFIGIILFLVSMERKLNKIEKKDEAP